MTSYTKWFMSFICNYLCAYRRNGINAGVDPEAVSVAELLPLPAVEGDPGGVSTVRGHGDLQLHPRRHHDRPEGEGVRADGSHHHGGYGGMDHAGTGRHGVGRTAGRRGDDKTVTLKQNCIVNNY